MKGRRASSISLLALAAAAAGCVHAPPRQSPEAVAPARREPFEVIQLDRQTLTFRPSRDDLTVASAVLTVHCSRPEEVRVNGGAPASQWKYIDLARVEKNRFELPPLRIEFSPARSGLLCLSVKVWFNEVTNQYDSLFYEKLDDRYALVSWCTSAEGPDWEQARPRFKQNRVGTLEQFKEALAKPIEIRLNQRPLADLERLAPGAGKGRAPEASGGGGATPSIDASLPWPEMEKSFAPPARYQGRLGEYRSLMKFDDGAPVMTREDWPRRREEILRHWHGVMGAWPPLLDRPRVRYLEKERVEDFTRHKVQVEFASDRFASTQYLLVPDGRGPFPAVLVTWYGAGDSAGLSEKARAPWTSDTSSSSGAS